MDIKMLLEQIRVTRERLDSANSIIRLCGENDIRRAGTYVETNSGRECYLTVTSDHVYELAVSQKEMLETQLTVLEDAKNTAERVIAGLLPDSKTSA